MKKECSPDTIMDAGWDYDINLDDVEQSFHNPPDDCRSVLDAIDKTIIPVTENSGKKS